MNTIIAHKNCFFCDNSNMGYVCDNCSTSGTSYKIECPACLGEMVARRMRKYKGDMNCVIDKDLEKLCDKHKEIAIDYQSLKI